MFSDAMSFNDVYGELNRQLNAVYVRFRQMSTNVPQRLTNPSLAADRLTNTFSQLLPSTTSIICWLR
jgi:hypothetical protein